MMKIISILLISLLQFSQADALLNSPSTFQKGYDALMEMNAEAAPGKEKAEVLWRLSKACLLIGQTKDGKELKREWFGKGIEYALQGIKEDAKSAQCYMWHSANVGRDCQTRPLTEQAAAVSPMMQDHQMILEKLGRTDCSESWQALSEIYVNHPFKSTDSGINFARKAAMTVPSKELRLSTYSYFAGLLKKRGWSAEKRRSQIERNAKEVSGKKGAIEAAALLDGSLGSDFKPAWSEKSLGEMSDAQEAEAIIAWAKKKFETAKSPTDNDKIDYKRL
jgi:hypothetical protein